MQRYYMSVYLFFLTHLAENFNVSGRNMQKVYYVYSMRSYNCVHLLVLASIPNDMLCWRNVEVVSRNDRWIQQGAKYNCVVFTLKTQQDEWDLKVPKSGPFRLIESAMNCVVFKKGDLL